MRSEDSLYPVYYSASNGRQDSLDFRSCCPLGLVTAESLVVKTWVESQLCMPLINHFRAAGPDPAQHQLLL